MTHRKVAAAGLLAAIGVAIEPLRSLAATTADCNPPPVVPESPAGPALLVVAAFCAVGVLAYRRRRRSGLATTVGATLVVVVLCSALLGTVLASAASASCPGGGTTSPAGGVAGIATSTPLTGADIPWIAGGVLVLAGTVIAALSPRRRRPSTD